MESECYGAATPVTQQLARAHQQRCTQMAENHALPVWCAERWVGLYAYTRIESVCVCVCV